MRVLAKLCFEAVEARNDLCDAAELSHYYKHYYITSVGSKWLVLAYKWKFVVPLTKANWFQ